MKKKVKKRSKRVTAVSRGKAHEDQIRENVLRELASKHHTRTETQARMYKFGFWLFFVLAIFSVTFSVWAISSIYTNFQTVTNILDESFERTNLVLDITSSKINSCEEEIAECKEELANLHTPSESS